MVREYEVRGDCRLCSGALELVLDLGDTPLANEYPTAPIEGGQDTFPLYLTQCQDCGHVQLPVIVDPERLFRNYAYQSATSPVFRQHLAEFAVDVQPAKPGGLVVEIGSNDGTLLGEYRRLGYRVLGVDPARNLVDAANAGGLDTIPEFFSVPVARDILAKHGPADLVVALNVFAHADDLAGITQGISELLAPGGQFVFEVGYLADVIANGLYRVIYHEHLSYHSVKPLVKFFERFGLTLRDVRRVSTQGGSIRCTVEKGQTPKSEALWAYLDYESKSQMNVAWLAELIKSDKAKLRAKLDQLKAAGKVVCGYGAPAQLTTTCYTMGITRDDVAFIVDDNPNKQGRYTPGLFIPIIPPGAIVGMLWGGGTPTPRLREPDACIIFSANFAADIRARHPGFRGEWVEL